MSGESRPPKQNRALSLREAAFSVVKSLQEAGYVALFAGGCVRDMVMHREPHDYDVATSATPDEVAGLFRRTQMVGAQFGVALVRQGRRQIEVATFRTDKSYEDGRRPTAVEFSTPEEDAKRRDFTINGMFMDPVRDEIVDHVGGRADIEAGIIRAIGEPEARFAEDHLRLLRAVRFAARFGFSVEPDTWAAICRHAEDLARITPERTRMELEQILSHPSRGEGVRLLAQSALLPCLFENADRLMPWIDDRLSLLNRLPAEASFDLALSVLLADSEVDAADACEAMRCSNATQARTKWLIANRDAFRDPARVGLADLKLLMAQDGFEDLLALSAARFGEAPVAEIQRRTAEIDPAAVAPTPFVNGHDLTALGLPAGPDFKRILDAVYYAQLNDDLGDRGAALRLAKSLMQKPDG